MFSWLSGAPEIEKLYVVARNGSTVETLENEIQKRKLYLTQIADLFGRLGYKVECVNPDFNIEVIGANGWGTGGDPRLAIGRITPVDELEEDFVLCNADYVITRKLPGGKLSPQLNISDIIDYQKSCKRTLDTVMTIYSILVTP